MNVRFLEIDIEGFMSIGKSTISLTDRGLTLVQGVNRFKDDNARSNGSGKSSIFEAIYWTLTGTTIRGTKDVINKNYSSGCSCSLTFEYNGDKFTIVRSRGHEINGTSVKLYINDEDKSGKGIKETEKLIESSLDMMDTTIISSVIILGQGLPSKFTSYSAANRKQLLENMSRLSETLDVLNDKLAIRNSQLSTELREVLDQINGNASKMDTYKKMIEDKTRRMSECSERSIDEIKAEKAMVTEQMISIEEQRKDLKNAYNEALGDRTSSERSYHENNTNARNLEREMTYTLNQINQLLDNRVCPTCGRPHDEETLKTNLIKAQDLQHKYDDLAKMKLSHEQAAILAKNDMEYYESQRVAFDTALNTISTTLSDLFKIIEKDNTLLSLLSQDQSDIESMEKEIVNLTYETEGLLNKQMEIQSHQKDVSTISRFASREFRGYMIDGVIEFINDRLKVYSSKLFSDNSIAFYLDGNSISIEVNGKSYEGLSGGERQKVDIAIQFSLRDMIMKLSGFNCNILVMDEVFDNLDQAGCEQLLDVIQTSYNDIESVYIITHHTDIPIPYDSKLIVDKDVNNLSSVREE